MRITRFPPDCQSSLLEAHGHWIPATGRIFGRRADVAHPLDPVIVPSSAKCLNSKMVEHYALTNVNSDRGFESWSGYEVKPPDSHSSLEGHGQKKLGYSSHRPHIWETSRCCAS